MNPNTAMITRHTESPSSSLSSKDTHFQSDCPVLFPAMEVSERVDWRLWVGLGLHAAFAIAIQITCHVIY